MVTRHLILSWLIGGTVWAGAACADELPEGTRRYADGPLSFDDFQGKPPADSPRTAMTYQRMRWDLKYETKPSGNGATARLMDIHVFAVVDRKASWIRDSETTLLDHEQGHFDLTQIAALEQELKFQQQRLVGKSLIGRGADRQLAIDDLQRQIEKAMESVRKASLERQKAYDEATQHGVDAAAQAAHRRQQREELARLTQQRKSSEKK